MRQPVSERLPDFPWDHLAEAKATAQAHPDGVVDLSVGTPVDPTPDVVQQALAAAADSPGYPATIGQAATRQAVVDWLERRFGVTGLGIDGVLPVTGSKELIAHLPTQLGLGPGDLVVQPELAYPTYEVGAVLAGCDVAVTDAPETLERTPALVWVNSPANPTGKILTAERLAEIVAWGRANGAVVVVDECYLECVWEGAAVSALHPSVCGGSFEGLLTVHSLSKRSNLAGYRCAFVAGDPALVAEMLAVRKNLGLQMPDPQQHAMAVALGDDAHVAEQHARYAARRDALRTALEAAGFRVDHSEGALYLWSTKDEDCWDTVAWLAERGILVAPGSFYGAAGSRHVRVAITATDERVAAAVARLQG
ncbi:succinyldiaminopimelate transaminase [Marmoricola endophyticus]|uniref:Succinyldiaminopimelate transaminase n=1 Tax=Marmoricola endophyticus TaxID=2040280 RepID=A0A917F870_9ACTN|nr:succinyldiaminopimelate transaminase [Marmoricola endophyticus]GGF54885.1 succinyldiaminopimelate transaminase [Marmoricola endophyticus]